MCPINFRPKDDFARAKAHIEESIKEDRVGMFAKSLYLTIVAGMVALSTPGSASAVELRKTPYLPSLQPAKPPIPRATDGVNRPGPGARECYGSTTCRRSGTYLSGEGVMIYRNGEPLEVRPSTRKFPTRLGPSSNHIQWCANRYRSYRTSDDSYQPLAGPRQSCNSPFR